MNTIIIIIGQWKWNLLMLVRVHILTLVMKTMINMLNLKKIKSTVPWTYVLEEVKSEKVLWKWAEKYKSNRVYNLKSNKESR